MRICWTSYSRLLSSWALVKWAKGSGRRGRECSAESGLEGPEIIDVIALLRGTARCMRRSIMGSGDVGLEPDLAM